MAKKGNVYLWTGNGWGKTTSSIGCAVRAVGHGKQVIIVQFMKGWKERIGEYRIRKKLGAKYDIKQFGRVGWVDLKNPVEKDKKLAQKALAYAREKAKKKPFLIVLDEVNVACSTKLLPVQDVLDFLDEIDPNIHVYLTGRWAPKKLIDRVDYANEIRMLKGPKKLRGEVGIDY